MKIKTNMRIERNENCKINFIESRILFLEKKSDIINDVNIIKPTIVIKPLSFPLSKIELIVVQDQVKAIDMIRKIKFSFIDSIFVSVTSFIIIAHNGYGYRKLRE